MLAGPVETRLGTIFEQFSASAGIALKSALKRFGDIFEEFWALQMIQTRIGWGGMYSKCAREGKPRRFCLLYGILRPPGAAESASGRISTVYMARPRMVAGTDPGPKMSKNRKNSIFFGRPKSVQNP